MIKTQEQFLILSNVLATLNFTLQMESIVGFVVDVLSIGIYAITLILLVIKLVVAIKAKDFKKIISTTEEIKEELEKVEDKIKEDKEIRK